MSEYVSKGARPEYYHFSQSGWTFAKEHSEYEQGWVEFHRRHAKLRPLCREHHSEVTRMTRRPRESAGCGSDFVDEVVRHSEQLQPDAAYTGPDSSEES